MIINPPPAAGGSMHRLKRGTKASEIPTLAATGSSKDDLLNSIDGPFQLAEYLACRVRADPHDVKGLVEVPKNGQDADRDVWIYEHLRRLPVDLAPLVSQLLTICSRDTCPSMKADEWLYLCVAHGSGGTEECCAIDYILHTLDSTTTLLNSTKNFPSRMSIPAASLNNFPSLSRRLSRIFSHAYFHHREAFLTFEADSSLYARFMALCETYGLVGSSLLVIPREESGLGVDAEEDEEEDDEDEDDDEEENGEGDEEVGKGEEEEEEEEEVDSSWSEGNDRCNHPANESADTDSDSHSQSRSQSRRRRSLSPSATLEHKILLRPKAKTGTKAEAEAEAEATKDEAADHPRTAPSLVSTDNNTSDSASRENTMNTDKPDVPIPETAVKASTRGRGTLSRGKQARGTVLWSSDAPPVPVNESKSSSSSKGDDGEDKSGGEDK